MSWLIIILATFFLSACQPKAVSPLPYNSVPTTTPSLSPSPSVSPSPMPEKLTSELLNIKPNQKMFANIKTSAGIIEVELFHDKTPNTVANFVGLSEGTKSWTNPQTGKIENGKSLYAGTIFHRVIKDFMIQGGDPLGNGTGGPGYRFADEIDKTLSFDKAGLLAMANSGANTNGSQFFITVVPTVWLNGKHTIFGKIANSKSQKIVDEIVNTPTDSSDRPLSEVRIESITIVRK